MKKIFFIITIILITACAINYVEDIIDPTGVWTLAKVEEYINTDCTGELVDITSIVLVSYSTSYTITEDNFTYTLVVAGITLSESGNWTLNDSTLTLTGDSTVHGSKIAKILSDEVSMEILEQSDSNNDTIIDTCTKYTYNKD